MYLFELVGFVLFFDKYPEVELNDNYIFEESSSCFPQWLYIFMSFATVHKDLLFCKSLSTLVVSFLFGNRHSDRYEVTHCNLDLFFFDYQLCSAFLSVRYMYGFLGKCFFISFFSYFNQIKKNIDMCESFIHFV